MPTSNIYHVYNACFVDLLLCVKCLFSKSAGHDYYRVSKIVIALLLPKDQKISWGRPQASSLEITCNVQCHK